MKQMSSLISSHVYHLNMKYTAIFIFTNNHFFTSPWELNIVYMCVFYGPSWNLCLFQVSTKFISFLGKNYCLCFKSLKVYVLSLSLKFSFQTVSKCLPWALVNLDQGLLLLVFRVLTLRLWSRGFQPWLNFTIALLSISLRHFPLYK